jgi:valyl-tRNA synthetase
LLFFFLLNRDHAGIATQLQVEKALLKEGISKSDIGRSAFLDRVWSWKEEKGGYIINQMKVLGASADWSRLAFTLDDNMTFAVSDAFIRLFNKGLIYKGEYMVNWSPSLQTAVSDLEVEYSEESGFLYHLKYYFHDNDEYLSVATTRPETIFGDSAVCVNPSDARYSKYIGKEVVIPISKRKIKGTF